MDIKLRARLSAYSKIESMQSGSTLPDAEIVSDNALIGVKDGKYKMYESVPLSAIGGLFNNPELDPTTIHTDQIDTLFPDKKEVVSVQKSSIDSLFDSTLPPDSTIVSFEAIDSLFK